MPLNRTRSRVAIGLFMLLLASPAFGQGPLGFQVFAPADNSTYGGQQQPNEGYFFQFDGLYWNFSAPKTTVVGDKTKEPWPVYVGNTQINEVNTLDTSSFGGQWNGGTRFEFGRIEDNNGWFASIFQVGNVAQNVSVASADILFDDPIIGTGDERLLYGPTVQGGVNHNLPTAFYDCLMTHKVSMWSVELMYLHRMHTFHKGGTIEWFAGPRYMEYNDSFYFRAGNSPTDADGDSLNVPSFLENSTWQCEAQNHIVGPEVGLRWFKKQGRWTLSAEGRFMAGLNCQNINEQSDIGPNLNAGSGEPYQPAFMNEKRASANESAREFSPVIELRIEGRYQITRAISAHAGWTGMWADGIAYGSSMMKYAVPNMGIDMANNREQLFVNGLTIGFDINR